MKPKEAMVFDKISSDGDSGFRDDYSESVSSGSQRGMTARSEAWRVSKAEPQRESGFNFLPHKNKHASSRGIATIFTHNKKSGQVPKESFIQKTKRKLFGKAKKTSTKAKESKEFQSKSKGIEPEDGQIGKNVIEEKLIDFPGVGKERRIGSATIERDESAGATIKTTRAENKYCSSTTKTNCGEVHTFVTRPRSMLRVMYDFRAREENDVSVRRGEMVTVLNKDDQDWWWVENSKLQQGFVPKKYIWPCACYVCQKFVLQRVVNIPGQKFPVQDAYEGGPYSATVMVPAACCMNRNGIDVTRPLAKTWC